MAISKQQIIKMATVRDVYPKIRAKDKRTKESLALAKERIVNWERMADNLVDVSRAYDLVFKCIEKREAGTYEKKLFLCAENALNRESVRLREILKIRTSIYSKDE